MWRQAYSRQHPTATVPLRGRGLATAFLEQACDQIASGYQFHEGNGFDPVARGFCGAKRLRGRLPENPEKKIIVETDHSIYNCY